VRLRSGFDASSSTDALKYSWPELDAAVLEQEGSAETMGAYGWPWKVASGPVRLVTQTSFGSAEGKVRTSTCAIPPKRPAFSAALRSSSARPHHARGSMMCGAKRVSLTPFSAKSSSRRDC